MEDPDAERGPHHEQQGSSLEAKQKPTSQQSRDFAGKCAVSIPGVVVLKACLDMTSPARLRSLSHNIGNYCMYHSEMESNALTIKFRFERIGSTD